MAGGGAGRRRELQEWAEEGPALRNEAPGLTAVASGRGEGVTGTVQGEVRPIESRESSGRGGPEVGVGGVAGGGTRRGHEREGWGGVEGEGEGEGGGLRRVEGRRGAGVPRQQGAHEWDTSSGSSTEVVSPLNRREGRAEASGRERAGRGKEGESRREGEGEAAAEGAEEIAAGIKWITLGDDILKMGVAQGVERLVQSMPSLASLHLRPSPSLPTPNPVPKSNPNSPHPLPLAMDPQWHTTGAPTRQGGVPARPPATAELLSQRLQAAAACIHPRPRREAGDYPGSAFGAPGQFQGGAGGPEGSQDVFPQRSATREGVPGAPEMAQLIPALPGILPATQEGCRVDPAGGVQSGGVPGAPWANVHCLPSSQPGVLSADQFTQIQTNPGPASKFTASQGAKALEALIRARPRERGRGAQGQREEGEGLGVGEGRRGGEGRLAQRGAGGVLWGQQSSQAQADRDAFVRGVGGSMAVREGTAGNCGIPGSGRSGHGSTGVGGSDAYGSSLRRQQFEQQQFEQQQFGEQLFGPRQPGQQQFEAALAAIPRAPRGMAREAAERDTSIVRKRLLRLATAVERGDLAEVQSLFSALKPSASSTGSALQRVLHYYLHALMLRLTGLGPAFLQKESRAKPQELHVARRWFIGSFPMLGFTGVAITGMILGKLLGRSNVHVIDLGQGMTPQWPHFLGLLAQQPGQPLKHIRFTWLDTMFLMNPGHTSYNAVESGEMVSRGLQRVAQAAGIGFTFEHVVVDRRSMQVLYEVRRHAQDTLVVTASFDLMLYPGDASAGARRQLLLEWLKFMEPAAVAVVELDVDARAKPLVSRVKACFDYHLATLGAHDACSREEDLKHLHTFERVYFGQFVTRLIGCDAQQRLIEMCSSKVWGDMFAHAGFRRERLSGSMLDAAYEVVKCFSRDFGLTLVDEALGLTWQGRSLLFASSFVP